MAIGERPRAKTRFSELLGDAKVIIGRKAYARLVPIATE
jgi:hypothetical protein